MAYDDAELTVRRRMTAEGFRFVHARSARKHRRQRHEVRWVSECRCYAWRAKAGGA